MFCPNCGSEVEDGSKFCGVCGTSMTEDQGAAPESGGNSQEKKKKTIKIALGAAAAAVIVGLLLVVFGSGALGGGYKQPLNKIVKLVNTRNSKIEKYLDAALPKFVGKAYIDLIDIASDIDDIDDEIEEMEESFSELFDDLEDQYGKNAKVSFKVEDKKEVKQKDLRKIEDFLENVEELLDQVSDKDSYIYEEITAEMDSKTEKKFKQLITGLKKDLKDIKITKGYELELTVSVKGSEDEDEDDLTLCVIKVNGKWCLCPPTDELSSFTNALRYLW